MSRYAKGRRLEWLARDALIAQGYTVIRSAGSKGPVDLVAIGPAEIRLIQVKAVGGVRRADLRKLRQVACPPGTRCEIWQRAPRGQWKVQRLRRHA